MNSKESLATLLKSGRQSTDGRPDSPQLKGLKKDFANRLTSKPGFLVSGIVAGMVAMLVLNCLVGARQENSQSKKEAAETSESQVSPAAPVTPAPPVIPAATTAAPAKSSQSAYGKPDQWRALPPSEPGVTTVWSYDPPRAVDGPTLPASVLNQNLPTSAPIYPPAGYVVQEEAGAQQVGRNGLLANPCVDPPSTHGTAYGRNH